MFLQVVPLFKRVSGILQWTCYCFKDHPLPIKIWELIYLRWVSWQNLRNWSWMKSSWITSSFSMLVSPGRKWSYTCHMLGEGLVWLLMLLLRREYSFLIPVLYVWSIGLVPFPQDHWVMWLSQDDLQDLSSWSSPPILFLRDIHSKSYPLWLWGGLCSSQSQSRVGSRGGHNPPDTVSE